ncbi:adenylate/guanylate cyclase domain-containing protein [Roseofilum reptotaenium CS-1145]|uniref:Adenylate/guanylate cyclase domain-containing protein n=1 Tax=Roseofilum reptotaenium AO1-A TaxID=1925591 RepID=A0A1L9QLM3_9CYAN|nr:adenylate/guanylate cyclase domain-containing protein [Roseofilum reptotaenium]MDB9516935.1 adenylate/guanylate cyclase domain-containing protein [Roseofilum reptotaenium CS-1145]OJJ19765.1 adenylate/guanylate cyclase domain-containing protein [Roseofilum reptotaenium AO1-A]
MNRERRVRARPSIHPPSQSILKQKLNDSQWTRFISELLGNSGHFLIVKILTDIILDGWLEFIQDPTEYILIAAMLVQTWYLSRPSSHRFWGNILGVSIYTTIDLLTDGLEFFQDYIHIIFWLFSLMIATLQHYRFKGNKNRKNWIIPLESFVRSGMIVAFYVAVEVQSYELPLYFELTSKFWEESSHIFLVVSMLLVGTLLGLQSLQITKQREELQETAKLLGNMAEWGMGTHVVETALSNPEALAFQKCDRTIVFMDIRGFTHWCETTSPDLVASVLNQYYTQVEPAASAYQPLRITFTADEVMAIYATPEQGIAAAKAMQKAALNVLNAHHIGAGCAVHCGQVTEGLFGSQDVRTYTVIGDVVNTAKRLESATPAGEITLSDAVYRSITQDLPVKPCEPITAKGKSEKLIAWRLG